LFDPWAKAPIGSLSNWDNGRIEITIITSTTQTATPALVTIEANGDVTFSTRAGKISDKCYMDGDAVVIF